ncbi:MAG: hypothetical protein EAZ27_07270 [Cytophagales bacterium]|nr:MAG: hypothetical protein EAZ27_07270 [Cytophagales bacterium]
MQSYQLPHSVRYILFNELAKEKATQLTDLIEKSIDTVFASAKDIAIQKKLELKDELSKELATKMDIALVKAEIALVKSELRSEMRIYFLITIFVIIVLNKDAINLIGKLLGLVK